MNEPVEVIKPPALKPLLSIVATTHLGATNSKKTSKCFTGQPWSYRDGDFDNWLQKDQPNADTGVISTLAVSRTWLFAEAARALPGVEQTVDIAALGRSLIACGYTMTLVQAEEMVETTERGEKTGMRTNRYGNFFFVETGNPNDPVSVGFVHRDRRVWDASLGRTAAAGTPTIGSLSATWTLRNWDSRSLYSDSSKAVPLFRFAAREGYTTSEHAGIFGPALKMARFRVSSPEKRNSSWCVALVGSRPQIRYSLESIQEAVAFAGDMDGATHEASRLVTSTAIGAIGTRTSTGSATATAGTPTIGSLSVTRLTFSRFLREFSFLDMLAI